MPVKDIRYQEIVKELNESNTTLVAVSKTKPIEDIEALVQLGQVDFGENYVQELVDKQAAVKGNIRWHFIGHLQTNKVKYIAPFVHLVHSVDSLKLLKEINKQGAKAGRVIDCLLQVYIARETTKFGMDEAELNEVMTNAAAYPNVRIRGLMGMASFTDDEQQIRNEYRYLRSLYIQLQQEYSVAIPFFDTLSMGMSGDYRLAIAEGSNMVRIGSLIFGERNYNQQ